MCRLSQRVLINWPSGKPSHQREGLSLHCRAAWVGGLPSRAACKMLSVTERNALRGSDDTEGKPLGMKSRAASYLETCTVCMQAAELLAHDHEVGCMCNATSSVKHLIQLEQLGHSSVSETAACMFSAQAMHAGDLHDNRPGPTSREAKCSSFTSLSTYQESGLVGA